MRFKFQKPTGSHADTKELEYISALMQTCRPLRHDGSIEVCDIVLLLMSRYGVDVSKDAILDDVFVKLAGDLDQLPTGVMDIRQIAAMLMIPHLVKISHGVYIDSMTSSGDTRDLGGSIRPKGGEGHPLLVNDRSIEVLANEIVADTQENGLFGEGYEPVITRDFLRSLFEAHDEISVGNDVLDQMVEVAGGEGTRFNAKTFLTALTNDLQAWNVEWETRLSTMYADVIGLNALNQTVDEEQDDANVGKENEIIGKKNSNGKRLMHYNSDAEAFGSKSFTEKTCRVFTFSEIDSTADTYGSQAFVVFLWAAFISFYIAYVFSTDAGGLSVVCDNLSSFGCEISNAIVTWFGIMAQLIIIGGVFFLIGSLGNSIFLTKGLLSVLMVLASMAVISVSTILFFFKTDITNWLINTNWHDQDFIFIFFNGAALGIGCILLVLQMHTLARLLTPVECSESNKTLGRWLLPGAVPKELRTKKAATFKVNRMIENATSHHLGNVELTVHKSLRSSGFMSGNGHAMFSYLQESYKSETSGGVLWGWKEFISGRICSEEGVFFHSRLIASSLAQCLVVLIVVALVAFAYISVDDLYRDVEAQGLDAEIIFGSCNYTECYFVEVSVNNNDEIYFEISTGSFWNSSGYVIELSDEENVESLIRSEVNETLVGKGIVFDDALVDEINFGYYETLYNYTGVDTVSAYYVYAANTSDDGDASWVTENVRESDFYVAIGVGTFVSFCAIAGAILNYIPSFIMNVLKFRYGVIGSLGDQEFQRYKEGPDHPTLIFGIAFWSQMYTAVISFVVAASIAFFVVWNQSNNFILLLVAQVIGISVTLIPKIIAILLFRSYAFAGFYRKKVALSNFVFLLFECWSIATTVGFLLVRTVLLFLMTILYIGRIDTPFLANEVDKFDFMSNAAYLDRAPVYYRKDLLLHEAHRHPYIERLAALCLLKLNQGDSFGTRGGSGWRVLYVLTLMPWLKKYRATARKIDYSSESFKAAMRQSTLGSSGTTGGNFSDSLIEKSKKDLIVAKKKTSK